MQNPWAALRLILACFALTSMMTLVADGVRDAGDELERNADAIEPDKTDASNSLTAEALLTTVELRAEISALRKANVQLLSAAVIPLGGAALGMIWFGVASFSTIQRLGRRGDTRLQLSRTLDSLIDGLAQVERDATQQTAQVARMRAEQQRLKALASLTPEQLEAITQQLSPGARWGLILAAAGILIGLLTWVLSLLIG